MQILQFLKDIAPLAGQFALGQVNRIQSQKDITRQNLYNSPKEQLQRMREAGLGMANYQHAQASNQSALPETNKAIGNYATTSMQIKQQQLLNAEIRLKESEAARYEAETAWWLNNKEGSNTPNLTYKLGNDQKMQTAQTIAQEAASKIGVSTSENIDTKINLDNQEQRQRITNMITHNLGEGIQIEGYKLDNALKQLDKEWRPRMNQANLEHILNANDIQITDKALKNLDLYLRQHTVENDIRNSDLNRMTNEIGYKLYGVNYQQNAEYQKLVDKARDLWDGEGKKMSAGEFIRALGAQLYTIISGVSGASQMPNLPSINMSSQHYNEYGGTKNFIKTGQ